MTAARGTWGAPTAARYAPREAISPPGRASGTHPSSLRTEPTVAQADFVTRF